MRTESHPVAATLVDTYAREGAVRIPQPFAPHWIDALQERLERILHDFDQGGSEFPVVRRGGSIGVQNVILRDPLYRRWAIESPVAAIVGQVTRSQRVRFYFDNFFIKDGGSHENATTIHHDVPAFGFQGTQLPSFWLALTDVDEDNAPLISFAGSHLHTDGMFRSPIQKPGLPLLPGYREHREVHDYVAQGGFERRVHTCRRGDAIMLHPYCIHGSLAQPPDAVSRRRIGFSSRWLGDDVRWRGTVYHEVEASTHPRPLPFDAEPPDDLFPVVWDADQGNLAARTGRFTTHITLEPPKTPAASSTTSAAAPR